jgi:hypothetical protein
MILDLAANYWNLWIIWDQRWHQRFKLSHTYLVSENRIAYPHHHCSLSLPLFIVHQTQRTGARYISPVQNVSTAWQMSWQAINIFLTLCQFFKHVRVASHRDWDPSDMIWAQ